MTEKRFKATYEDGYCVCDEETDLLYHMDNEMITKEMSNLLNQLNNENEQLKHRINDYNIALKKLQDLTERKINENEQLKKENEGIQNKVIKLLDFVEVKQCVTRTEIKKWWNND